MYVLGAYPSGLHIQWKAPELPTLARRTVRALLVDNEPTPFWSGDGQEDRVEEWRDRVQWQPSWGEVSAPARGVNGPSGAWVDRWVLAPLGVGRDEVCISDCLDTARLNPSQGARVQDTYAPMAQALGLPACTVPPVPAGEPGIVQEARDGHLDRLTAEIRACEPTTLVTLGNAALRVVRLLAEDTPPLTGLAYDTFGQPLPAHIDGQELTWLPLVHPRSGERTPPWPDVHAAWASSRQPRLRQL